METVRLVSMDNTAHNTNITRQAYETSQFVVNRANNVATGRSLNVYAPYDINGNATSYYNSSRQTGKTPSPDAPRVEDVSGENIKYCEQDNSSLDNLWAQIKESLKDSSVVGISNSLIAFILSYEGAVAGYLKSAYETAKHLANKAAIVRNLSIATKAIPVVSTIIDTTLQFFDREEFGHTIIKSTAPTVFPASIPVFLIASGVTVVLSTKFDNLYDSELRNPIK